MKTHDKYINTVRTKHIKTEPMSGKTESMLQQTLINIRENRINVQQNKLEQNECSTIGISIRTKHLFNIRKKQNQCQN